MAVSRHDEGAATAAAWVRFQARLADALHALPDGRWIEIDLPGCGTDGTTVRLDLAHDDDVMRAVLVDDTMTDVRRVLGEEVRQRLSSRGWQATGEGESLHLERPPAASDAVAVEVVRALRDVLGIVHPVFLDAEGLERDPEAPVYVESDVPPMGSGDVDPMRPIVVADREELAAEVAQVIAHVLGVDDVERDDDGDFPLVTEHCTPFVRVARIQPAVEVVGSVVLGITAHERVARELEVLNASHALAVLTHEDDRVVLRHRSCALPFVPGQLAVVLESLLGSTDAMATELAARLGGRRFHDPDPTEARPPTPLDRLHHGLRALLELMGERRLTSATVSTLFAHDRTALTNHLTALRTGRIVLDLDELAEQGRDLDDVLDHLRRGLRHAVGVEVGAARAGRSLPPSHQLSLLPELERTLDDGTWDATGS